MAKQISLQPGFQQLQGNKHPNENNIPIRALIGMQRFVSLVITNFFFFKCAWLSDYVTKKLMFYF